MSCVALFWFCWSLERACYDEHAPKHHDLIKSCASVGDCFKQYTRGDCEDVLPNHGGGDSSNATLPSTTPPKPNNKPKPPQSRRARR